jgi:indolepyruvate ferredoxin oxidoreductase beta subunit
MKTDIILSGVGGQGILSISAVIGEAAVLEGIYIKQSEVHGMSQRGGDVQSNLRLSDSEVYSNLIPKGRADMVLSLEPMEALRYLPYLKPDGWIISHNGFFKNIPNYPEETAIIAEIEKLPHHILLDVESIAKETGSVRTANMVLLGAAVPFLNLKMESIEQGIRNVFARKDEKIIEQNIAALRAGKAFSEQFLK